MIRRPLTVIEFTPEEEANLQNFVMENVASSKVEGKKTEKAAPTSLAPDPSPIELPSGDDMELE